MQKKKIIIISVIIALVLVLFVGGNLWLCYHPIIVGYTDDVTDMISMERIMAYSRTFAGPLGAQHIQVKKTGDRTLDISYYFLFFPMKWVRVDYSMDDVPYWEYALSH